ncbi:uncharacterized protein Z518_09687 [Rhinocladiella mackenziei CBS 650.93]|uniref:FHA domain-containing protein n=1 Tax=Rhinocladiella mackenziei CBS 650.93 TaxID=1442369 RepID=A0A0D2FF34_9EURO|nr:uncharacterized protein Z518_09687 [Rhinocladiella mackenziei CBS 650.93]KIX00622.1 hypothetical protein Z518_09687 [Rhinocladiella mackenziei CBS 650.93]
MTSNDSLYATLTLRDVDEHDSLPERTIILKSPDWEIKIGRGTLSGNENLHPAKENAWFDSRVMSRDHAILLANPCSREIAIQDIGSMHGTHVAGRRLKANQLEILSSGDVVTLGADVTRGSLYFHALKVIITWAWSDECASSTDIAQPMLGNVYRNSFSADYSEEDPDSELYDDREDEGNKTEEDHYDDNESEEPEEPEDKTEVAGDSLRAQSIEIVIPPRTFTVPESDDSDAGSYISGEDIYEKESPASSPIVLSDTNEVKGEEPVEVSDSEVENVPPTHHHHPARPVAHPVNSSDETLNSGQIQKVSLTDDSSEDYAHGEDDACHEELVPQSMTSAESMPKAPGLIGHFDPSTVASKNPLTISYHSETIRTPSPSDAAMVKPSIESHFSPPFSQQTPSAAVSDGAPGEPGRSTSAWAGHNSVLYEPMPHGQVMSGYGAQEVIPAPQLLPSMSFMDNWESSSFEPTYLFQDSSSFLTGSHQTSRVSIANIVAGPPTEKPLEPKSNSLKRKADQTSSDSTLGDAAGSPELVSAESDESAAVVAQGSLGEENQENKDQSHTTPDPVREVAVNKVTSDAEMPPRKKVKKSKSRQTEERGKATGNFVKIAAAAMAGMAIGTVGTIVGLAALPQDYFV